MTCQGDEPILTSHEDRLYSIFEFCLKLFLFLSPIFYFGDLKGSFAQSLFFIFASILLFSISLALKPRRHFSNLWISLFLIWSILSIFFHGAEIGKMSKLAWPIFAISSDGVLYILAGFLLFKTVFEHVRFPERFLMPLILVCFLNLVFVILQTKGIDLIYTYRYSNCGLMGISSQLGSYSAMALPLLLFLHPILVVLPVLSLFFAKSFSPIFAVIIGFICFNLVNPFCRKCWKGKIQIFLLILLLLSISFFYWDQISARWIARLATWQQLVKATFQRPFIGWGWRSYLDVVPQLGKPVLERPHQDWGHLASEVGIIGIIFIGGYLKNLWQRFDKIIKDRLTWLLVTSVFIILINMSVQTTIRYANIAGTFIILLAFLEIKLYESKSKAQSGNSNC